MTFSNCKLIGDQIDSDAYQRQSVERGHPEYVMSRSGLMLFAHNPSKWIAGFKPKDSDATDWGNLCDCLVTDPDRLTRKYSITPKSYSTVVMECPCCGSVTDSKACRKCGVDRFSKTVDKPWNGAAEECKAWKNARGESIFVSSGDWDEATAAYVRLKQDEIIARLLACSKKQVFVTGEYHDTDTKLVIPVKSLIDLVPDVNNEEFGKSLADFKTARSAAPMVWDKVIYDRHYDAQGAMHLDMYVGATGEDRVDFRHVIQENYFPWQTGRRIMTAEDLDNGRYKISTALKLYARCLKTGSWPSWEDSSLGLTYRGWLFTKHDERRGEWLMSKDWTIATPGPLEEDLDDGEVTP